MTTQQVANRLVELCRQGKIDEVQDTLFADNAQSVEANDRMGPKVTTGLTAIKEKGKVFQSKVEEFHAAIISEPIVAGDTFAITWVFDATMKGQGRMTLAEVCAYKVENGKITLEQFIY
ncbi:MAG: SnoaL-like domain-containing protein [Bacteroidota bacterium]